MILFKKLEENKQSSTLFVKKKSNTRTFAIVDQQLSDPAIISNTFNSYFTNMGPKLASNIETGAAHFNILFATDLWKSVFLNPTNSLDSIEIVRYLKNSKWLWRN